MANNNTKTQIIVALISASALIIVAIISGLFQRHSSDIKPHLNKQHNILAGTVIDASTNKSIGQAEITVIGRNEQYYTENNGNFNFPIKDSVGHVRIRVTKLHYQPYDKTYDLPAENIIIQLSEERAH